ncbi:cobalamin biosynthesis protein CobD [Dysgonomonas sp. 216]|uniref:adenosylcobinamide-phosphate synthase CbiB n=1 Tax=Dysgonomonas sp. 216 TaxID=2302934 RepID=UPI0013D1406B|nr:adenosylcobinamide-phosphate synthase CbiB [Dysgonomonas sp. 216]NDW17810.1 cobalamin biosynthesis protein CobD [Dysgonomonas sp. 216]
MDAALLIIIPLLLGWIIDMVIGDPRWLPHPIVGFGKLISLGEKTLNKEQRKKMKGSFFSLLLITGIFVLTYIVCKELIIFNKYIYIVFSGIIIFYCIAGKTLITEVKQVFIAVDKSTEDGRQQVARIVGRDTSQLSDQQIRTAALETLSENLCDGIIAPLFWYALLGIPGILTYKMVNTLDSMIGYKNERYKQFGWFAAKSDDLVNYIPARLTAFFMILVSRKTSLLSFVRKYGTQHASPNSGYPEAALAGILNCRFGGPNNYFGQIVEKPYIGNNNRELTYTDMQKSIAINRKVEALTVFSIIIITLIVQWLIK